MSKSFWGVIVLIVLVFGGIMALGGKKTDDGGAVKKAGLTQHVQGAGTAGVTLIEYGDYECPYCQAYYPTIKQIQAEYGDKLKFQFRNYPLTNLHQNAFAAARAAEAADLQGKFWEMHDMLYESANYFVWTKSGSAVENFNQYAEKLGLNVAQFKKDFASSLVNDRINADLAAGTKLKLTGTPSFILNGKKTEIANSPEAFRKVIDAAIAKQQPADGGSTEQTTAPAAEPAPAQ